VKTAALVTLIISAVLIFIGLIPCAGILNWGAVPFCIVPAIIGVIGLATDKDEETGTNPNMTLYILSIVVPLGLALVGTIRCAMGGFVL
jgi:hypothetical protein